jgi:RNA polymerase sigma factor (TIGR02999 family)
MTQDLFNEVLVRFRSGDSTAREQLADIVYSDLRRIAQNHLRGKPRDATLSPTSLVNESYIRLVSPSAQHVETRAHFFALASTIMRQIVCDYSRAKLREAPVVDRGLGSEGSAELVSSVVADASQTLFVDRALEELFKHSARQARIAECRIFGGMTDDETAIATEIPLRTVQREWNRARKWLSEYAKESRESGREATRDPAV